MANDEAWTSIQKVSMVVTLGAAIFLSLLAWASVHNHWLLWLAASVGGLGGLVHEIAQSGGKIAFFEKNKDGMYLGSLAGIVLGAVAGILVIRGHLIATPSGTELPISMTQLAYEVFIAGLALKGVTEAAGGNPVT